MLLDLDLASYTLFGNLKRFPHPLYVCLRLLYILYNYDLSHFLHMFMLVS